RGRRGPAWTWSTCRRGRASGAGGRSRRQILAPCNDVTVSTAAGTTASPDVAVLVDVARDLVGVALRSIAPEPVSAAQFRLLLLLHEDGSMPSASAARSLGVAPSSITRVTVRLA